MFKIARRHVGLLAGVMLGLPLTATAEPITALTGHSLLRFDSASPGVVTEVVLSGLVGSDQLIGIDRRPSLGPNNGVLYSISNSGRIYTLNETNGVATVGALLTADPADTTVPFPFTSLQGTQFGIDFNPTVDRLRLTSDTGQNLRINVDNGLVQLDVPLAYETGDPNFGFRPEIVGVAYSNNFGGAMSTTLRGVDIARNPDLLAIHVNPNGGTLSTSMTLPFNTELLSYDISGITGIPYFSVNNVLYMGTTQVGVIGTGRLIHGIATGVGPAQVPEPAALTLLALGAVGLFRARRRLR